jgi:hypothetical protein
MLRKSFCLLFILGLLIASPILAKEQVKKEYTPPDQHEFILYAFPPAADLNWASPRKLMWGAGIKGRMVFEHGKNKHTIGHCFMELKSPDGDRELTGSTTAPDAPSDADFITKHGYGLGVLFAPMKGALDKSEKLEEELHDRYQTGKAMFIRFIISEKAYDRMKQYIDEYRERGYDGIYNGMNEPRKGTGAGCSAFAMSFLDVCGYVDPFFKKYWIRKVNLPTELVGGPITGNHVSLTKTIFKARWAKDGEESIPLELYDPQLMYEWMHKVYRVACKLYKKEGSYKKMKILGTSFKFVKRGRALGILVDIRHLPPATDPIWKVEE